MNKFILIFLAFFIFISVSALCNKTQININSASKKELDKLYGIGPSKADSIIASRPFSSVKDLIKVKGIGNVTLGKIIKQGLACVSEENEKNNSNSLPSKKKQTDVLPITYLGRNTNLPFPSNHSSKIKKENLSKPIKLSPKNIKSVKIINYQKSNGNKVYPKYLLWMFSILLLFLFFIKSRKRKNEWKK